MRVIATVDSNSIVQTEETPSLGTVVSRNGHYAIPLVDSAKISIDETSIVTPTTDPASIVAQNFTALLREYPQYSNIVYNALIADTDLDGLDTAAVLNENNPVTATHVSRLQFGRGTGGPLPSGNAPNSVACLEQNAACPGPGMERPGVIVTDTIDITALTGGAGATTFAVYWYIYEFSTTPDVNASFGALAGTNDPAIRQMVEVDQEPADFEVWLSGNNGTWFGGPPLVQRLKPVTFAFPATELRIAFKNTNNLKKRYLAHYALMF